jgi:ribosome maturation factor RimP
MGPAILERVRFLIEPVLQTMDCELVDARFLTEHGRRLLRVFVDREGGVTVGDCERVSREIETLLEIEGVLGERSVLEVSSPGLDRPLTKPAHFEKYAGKSAAVTTSRPVEAYGERRNYKGLIRAVEDGKVVMEIDGQEFRVPLDLIEKAHLVFEGR